MNSVNKESSEKTPKYKRVAALVCVALLVGMYVGMLIMAFIFPENAMDMFVTAMGATVALPILLWLFIWMMGIFTGRHNFASLDAMTSDMDHDEYGNPIPRENTVINTIIFDIGNVLVDFSWKEMLQEKGYNSEQIEKLGKATVFSGFWNEYDKGILSSEEVRNLFKKNTPELAEDIENAFGNLTGMVRIRNYSKNLIGKLKDENYQVLVLSNFSKQCLEENEKDMDFLENVDGGIISYREKLIKPDSKIYQKIIEKYALTPSRCVFIDDTKENIVAARKEGINGIVFESYEQMLGDLRKLGVRI